MKKKTKLKVMKSRLDYQKQAIVFLNKRIAKTEQQLYDMRMTGNPIDCGTATKVGNINIPNTYCTDAVRDDGSVITKDNVIRKLKDLLTKEEERTQTLLTDVDDLKRRLAAPAADVKGYEDAFIDGHDYALNNAPFSYTATADQLRELYHDCAVQKAVFPDVINGLGYDNDSSERQGQRGDEATG